MINLTVYKQKTVSWQTKIQNITVDSKFGQIGIFPGHMKLLTVLDIGKIQTETGNISKTYAVAGGILKVNDNNVDIFTYALEEKDKIDKNRALSAKKRALEYLKKDNTDGEINFKRAHLSLKRAENRIQIKEA
jgi:F-type H+-transporting ATPase subunit epsilon